MFSFLMRFIVLWVVNVFHSMYVLVLQFPLSDNLISVTKLSRFDGHASDPLLYFLPKIQYSLSVFRREGHRQYPAMTRTSPEGSDCPYLSKQR